MGQALRALGKATTLLVSIPLLDAMFLFANELLLLLCLNFIDQLSFPSYYRMDFSCVYLAYFITLQFLTFKV